MQLDHRILIAINELVSGQANTHLGGSHIVIGVYIYFHDSNFRSIYFVLAIKSQLIKK